MADIAVVFGWAPRDMEAMTLEELGRWWQKARARAPNDDDKD
jgi:Phage P2 GpE